VYSFAAAKHTLIIFYGVAEIACAFATFHSSFFSIKLLQKKPSSSELGKRKNDK
jgi:hypothetical protein